MDAISWPSRELDAPEPRNALRHPPRAHVCTGFSNLCEGLYGNVNPRGFVHAYLSLLEAKCVG